MKIEHIDKVIEQPASFSDANHNEIFEMIRAEPLIFLFTGRYWLYFLILSLFPFILVIRLPIPVIAHHIPLIDPVAIKILSLLLFINKFSIHFLIKMVMVNWAVTRFYHASSRPIIRYRTVRIALIFFIIVALGMRFI